MSARADVLTQAECAALVPALARDANKYTRGVLAVIGGSSAYPAAPIMAAQAASRAGAGYVRLLVPRQAAEVARAHVRSVTVSPCTATASGVFDPESAASVVQEASRADALAIGPGLSAGGVAGDFLDKLLACLHERGDTRPALLDADALTLMAAHPQLAELREGCDDVMSPHEGEAARLLGRRVACREADALELAHRYGCTVVLKGPDTLVAAPDGRLRCCAEGGPELAKAGTGDVLSGIIGSFLAQGSSAFDAACLATFVHGRAGRLAAAEMSARAVMAEDIIEFIGRAFMSMGV